MRGKPGDTEQGNKYMYGAQQSEQPSSEASGAIRVCLTSRRFPGKSLLILIILYVEGHKGKV